VSVIRPPAARGRWWPWLVAWLVLTAMVLLAARGIDWDEAWSTIAQAAPLWVFVALVVNFTIFPVLAWQWVLFLPAGNRVAFPVMLRIMFIAAAVAHTGPIFAGHAAGVHLVATRGGTGYAAAVSAKALDQLSEGVSKLVMLGAVVALVPLSTPLRTVSLVLLLGVPVLFLVLFIVAHRAHVLERWASRRRGAQATTLLFLMEVARQMETMRRPAGLAIVLGLGLIQKTLEGLAIWAVLMALGLDVPAWGVLLCLTVVTFSTMVSVTPANLGVYEGSAVLAYGLVGLDTETALGAAMLQHAAYLIPFIGCGWATLAVEALRARSNRQANL